MQSEQAKGSSDSGQEYSLDIVDLSKSFKRHTRLKGAYTTLKSSLLKNFSKSAPQKTNVTHAIQNLTMRIPKGSSVGVIGRNGSGKSTLLKLITGIYKADTGRISVNGRIAALIELGAGFHPDFTGRENLNLGAVMHGLSRAQVRERFDEIVEFAELENVIDDPVRTYSSGMFMRLGFSLAIHTNPDILIVDEVLAVGDARFVSKCKEKIAELRKDKKTLILVTHDLDAVERWCDEAIWLNEGEVRDRGEPRRVIDHYRQFVEKGEEADLREEAQKQHKEKTEDFNLSGLPDLKEDAARWGSREIEIKSARLLAADGQEKLLFHSGDNLSIEFDYFVREPVADVVFGIGINRSDGVVIHGTNTDIEKIKIAVKEAGTVRFRIADLQFLEGNYLIDLAVHRQDGYPYDYHKNILKFAVRSSQKQVGVVLLKHTWEAA